MKGKETIPPLEQRIIDVFFKCIYKYGLSSSTIRVIAKEADIKPAAIQYYFPLKESLVISLVKDLHKKIISGIESSYSSSDPPEIKLEKILIDMENFILKRKEISFVYVDLLLSDGVRNPLIRKMFVEQIKKALNLVEELLKDGIEKEVFNKVNINSVARSFFIFARGCVIQELLEENTINIKRDIKFFRENIKKVLLKEKDKKINAL